MAAGVKFSGGDKLIAKLKKMGDGFKKGKLTVGFYEGAKYKDGTPVAQVAAIQNFGATINGGFIPPRPFFSDTINENQKKWGNHYANALINTDYDVERSARLVGEEARSDVIEKIDKNSYEPNAESTKNYKATAPGTHNQDPLKDTLHMMHSVGYSYNDESPQYSQGGN